MTVTVTDIRGSEDHFTLDSHGFQLVDHSTRTVCKEDGYEDESKVKSFYFPECEQLLLDVTGGSKAFIFDHKVRRGPSNWHKLGPNNSSKRGPLHRVHVDQSYAGAEFLVKRYFPNDAAALLANRWQIINVRGSISFQSVMTKRRPPGLVEGSFLRLCLIKFSAVDKI
jgi:hypothetical protein